MFYKLLRNYVKYLHRLYFDKIYTHGFEQLENDKPIIVVGNHPSAFTEGIVTPMISKRPLHFIMRGDIFNWWTRWFFEALYLVPIFRVRDGINSMKKNMDIFKESSRILNEGKAIVIYGEGLATWEKKLRPMKRGFVRIAFEAYKAHGVKDTLIYPLAYNFSDVQHLGHRLCAVVGKPIKFADYIDLLEEDERNGSIKLKDDLVKGLTDVLVNIDDYSDANEREVLLERLHDQRRPNSMATYYKGHPYPLEELKAAKSKEADLSDSWSAKVNLFYVILRWLILIPTLAIHALPLLLTHFLAKATPLKKEFISGLRIGYFVPIYLLFSFLMLAILWPSCSWWSLPITYLVLPLALWISFYELFHRPGAILKHANY